MIKPMLAYKVGKKPVDWTKPVFLQPKLDGVRCIIQRESDFPGQEHLASFSVKAYSRTGKPWLNIQHILDELKPFFFHNPDAILDGELYNHDLRNDFNKIISLVRKQKPTAEERSEASKIVQFHCYDYAHTDELYSERMENLLGLPFLYSYCVKWVPTLQVDEIQASAIHQQNLDNEYEGSILRLDGPYQCKRSYNLQKFKDFHDTEATIIGYVDGKGKREGTLGKFIMQDDDGIEFGCPPGKGYNYADLTNILNNIGDYIGKRATFTYFERTPAGSYRHPMFKIIRNYE
jgi:ATP-dependent DNA ligase